MAARDPYTGFPLSLTPEQKQAEDPDFAAANPAAAALNKKYNPYYGPGSFMYGLGARAMDAVQRPNVLGSILNQGPLAGGALGAGIGGLAGAGLGAITGRDPGRSAMLGALLAGGLGAYSGHLRKQGGWRSSTDDPKAAIAQALQSSGMEFNQKMQALSALPRLSDQQADQLAQAIRGAGGFAVGGIIAHYLLGWGLLGSVFGAGLGGMIGSNLYGGSHDAMGFKSLGNRDFSGNTISL